MSGVCIMSRPCTSKIHYLKYASVKAHIDGCDHVLKIPRIQNQQAIDFEPYFSIMCVFSKQGLKKWREKQNWKLKNWTKEKTA